MYYKTPVKVAFSIPKEILRAMAEESVAQGFLSPSMIERCVEENLVPLFSYYNTNPKYGDTVLDKRFFWKNVLQGKRFDLFFEKFPKMQSVEQDGVKFII